MKIVSLSLYLCLLATSVTSLSFSDYFNLGMSQMSHLLQVSKGQKKSHDKQSTSSVSSSVSDASSAVSSVASTISSVTSSNSSSHAWAAQMPFKTQYPNCFDGTATQSKSMPFYFGLSLGNAFLLNS